jgi:hypothetical protein
MQRFGSPGGLQSLARSSENADDRLSRAPLSRIERRNGVVQARDLADIRPQSSVPNALNDLG